MTRDLLNRRLTDTARYDMSFHSTASSDNGWKISIQGKNINDSIFLYEKLNSYLFENNVPFKVATIKRYGLRETNREQSQKAMTIYCPNGFDFSILCEDVYTIISDYKGWHEVKMPSSYSHYAGGLFVRNDRTETGAYIPAVQ